jgi:hypothetical protein
MGRKKIEKVESRFKQLVEAQFQIMLALHPFDPERRLQILNAALVLTGA